MRFFGRRREPAERSWESRDALAKKGFARAKQEFAAGRFDTAAAIFREVVALTPDSPNSQFLLGASLMKAGDPGAAVGPLRRCVAMRPEHAEGLFLLGVSLGRLDKFDEAAEHVAKAAALGDEQALARLPMIGIDYCRHCARPAEFRTGLSDTDIVIVDIKAGWTCAGCRTVLCGTCAGGATGASPGVKIPVCPDCGGRLRVLTN